MQFQQTPTIAAELLMTEHIEQDVWVDFMSLPQDQTYDVLLIGCCRD